MFAIIRIDHDECRHRVLDKRFATRKKAEAALKRLMPTIAQNNPGAKLIDQIDSPYGMLFVSYGRPEQIELGLEYHILETDRAEDFA